MADDSTPEVLAPEGDPEAGGGSPRLAVLYLVIVGLLSLFAISGAAVSAVDALLANPAESCGGP